MQKEAESKKVKIEVMSKGVDEKDINGNCCGTVLFAMRWNGGTGMQKETRSKKPAIKVISEGIDEKEINGNCCHTVIFAMR